MRKLAVFGTSMLLAAMLWMPTATASGVCTATGSKPVRSGSSVFFTGTNQCSTQHSLVSINVQGQRRPGAGGTWVTVSNSGVSRSNAFIAAHQNSTAFSCNKDYRTRAYGTASGGHTSLHFSAILNNTC